MRLPLKHQPPNSHRQPPWSHPQVMFTRLPMAGAHIQALIAYGTAYMVLLWAYGSTTGHWRYGLNW